MESCVPFGDEGCRSGWRRLAGVLAVASVMLLGWAASAHAATFVVRNTADSGRGSLRDAITRADANPSGDAITFSAVGTITLASPLPAVSGQLVIAGPSAGAVTISGDNQVQVLAVAPASNLWLGGVTIADGNAETAGGGIENAGNLVVTGVTFDGNVSTDAGGAIMNLGTAAVSDSTFTYNSSVNGGAAISNGSGATLTIGHVTFAHNWGQVNVRWSSGAITNSGTLTITDSTFQHNSGGGFGTAAIFNTRHATLSVTATRFIHNVQGNDGGDGAITSAGSLVITDSEFIGNEGLYGATVRSTGPSLTVSGSTFLRNVGTGVQNEKGTLTVTRSTFAQNFTDFDVSAIENDAGRAAITNSSLVGIPVRELVATVYNAGSMQVTASTIVKGYVQNDSRESPRAVTTLVGSILDTRCRGPFTDGGYNLDAGTTCGFSASGSVSNTDPMLQPLARNGGPTETMALSPTSPAVDAIPLGAIGCGTTLVSDQRGVSRPQGAGCDIGAYELRGQHR